MAIYNDIAIRFDNHQVRKTNNPAVFIKTPNTQKQDSRAFAEAFARGLYCKDEVFALGLTRSASVSALASGERASISSMDDASVSPIAVVQKSVAAFHESNSDASTDSDGDSNSDDDSSSSVDSDESDEFELDELDEMDIGREPDLKERIYSRASEQVMVANLKHLASKAKLRYGSQSAPDSSARRTVGQEACRFTEMYSDTVEILEASMTWKPPSRRRHSIDHSDLGIYCQSS